MEKPSKKPPAVYLKMERSRTEIKNRNMRREVISAVTVKVIVVLNVSAL
jgi:hypothetical protein